MDEKTVRTFIKCLAIGVTIITLSFVGCSINVDRKISQCIKDGNDPIECRVAFENDSRAETRALMAAIKDLSKERR